MARGCDPGGVEAGDMRRVDSALLPWSQPTPEAENGIRTRGPSRQGKRVGQPLRIESKNSAFDFVCLTLSTRNSVASSSSIG
jgi:hypothetical protein